ncbi:hypothetical protein K1719_039658 [Acacia pycnantha]|nr:hypothetical protein K1719_039658 [Acacia pycnantha]
MVQVVIERICLIKGWEGIVEVQLRRAELYKGLADVVLAGETAAAATGKRVILPSSFTGGARYTIGNYQDAMTICAWAGYPDLFITFTSKPKWHEITRYLDEKNAEDHPKIIARIFEMKLYMMMKDLKEGKLFGAVKAVLYTIEFQKRGLPHAHIVLFLVKDSKISTPHDIDKVISAKIPDSKINPSLYDAMSSFMIHGPCGIVKPNSPCMSKGECTKYYPKSFTSSTIIHEDGYPRYKRPDNGRVVMKNEVPLDNRYVIPYNPYLLLKYQAHVNVEKCKHGDSIKYLFKYVSKGHGRATVAFYAESPSE